mgnify:FL=1
MKKNVLYFYIAGFLIKLKFAPTQGKNPVNNIREKINNIYAGFIVKGQRGKKCLTEINFLPSAPYVFQKKLKLPYFTLAFYHVKNNKVFTYLHISINHFITLLLRVVQNALLKNNGFFLHCSAVEIDGKAHVFVGPSGAGKSTILNLTRRQSIPLVDESGIIIKENNSFYFYQSPVVEKYKWIKKTFKRYPIESIYFLRKAKDCRLIQLKNNNKIITLISAQTWSLEKDMRSQIKTIMNFVKSNPRFYLLYFAKNEEKICELLKINNSA